MSFYGTNDAIYGSGAYGTASYGITTPIVVPTGVSATGSIGAVRGTLSIAVSSVSGTGQIGSPSLSADVNETLTGVVATGFVTSVEAQSLSTLTGVSATGGVGTPRVHAIFGANDALYGTGRYGAASYGDVSPTINAPSLVATTAVEPVSAGGFEIDISEVLVGVSATITAGTGIHVIEPNAQPTGVEGTGAIGTVSPNLTETLNSVSGTGQITAINAAVGKAVVGVSATFTLNKGNRPFAKTFNTLAVPGVNATGGIGVITHSNTVTLSGVSGTAV